jgi:hypothetical protein
MNDQGRKIRMADPSNDPQIQELLRLLIESDSAHPPFIFSPFAKTGRSQGTNPHVGMDVVLRNQNEVNNGHPYLLSPFDGQIIEFQPKLGRIVIKGKDPVTGEVRLVELLHSQTQLFDPGHLPADVRRGQRIGTMGDVGASGRVHLHVQSFQAGDAGRTPLNPLKSLFEYLHPGEPVPTLDPFTPPQVSRERAPSLRPSDSNGRDQPSSAIPPASPSSPPGRAPVGPNLPTSPALKPPSSIGPPLDLTPHGLPPVPDDRFRRRYDPTGSLYFNPQPSPRQFGPFTLPGPGSSGTDISAPRNGNPASSSVPIISTPGQIGSDDSSVPGAALQPINGNAADRTGGNDIGGMWTTARQSMSGQPGQMEPAVTPSRDVPAAFPENGTSPIGYLNGARQTGTFDPAASDAPLPRPRPPQAPTP